MDLLEILSFTTMAFCGVIAGIVWIQRKLFEILLKKYKPSFFENKTTISKLYHELFVPAGPLGVGGLLAWLFSNYPFPEIFAGSASGRVFYGIFCGLISGWVYRVIKKMFEEKLKSFKAGNSIPPKEIL